MRPWQKCPLIFIVLNEAWVCGEFAYSLLVLQLGPQHLPSFNNTRRLRTLCEEENHPTVKAVNNRIPEAFTCLLELSWLLVVQLPTPHPPQSRRRPGSSRCTPMRQSRCAATSCCHLQVVISKCQV